MNSLNAALPDAVRQVLAKVRRNLQATLSEQQLDLSLPEAHILHLIREKPAVTPLELALQSGYDKAVVARKIKRLTEAGRLERKTDPGDQRRSCLTLTNSGWRCCEQLDMARREAHTRVFGPLTAQEQAQLQQLLHKCL